MKFFSNGKHKNRNIASTVIYIELEQWTILLIDIYLIFYRKNGIGSLNFDCTVISFFQPSNLSVDFERFVDSSSDSEVDDEERPFMLTKSKCIRIIRLYIPFPYKVLMSNMFSICSLGICWPHQLSVKLIW